jgi:hypothetical protein
MEFQVGVEYTASERHDDYTKDIKTSVYGSVTDTFGGASLSDILNSDTEIVFDMEAMEDGIYEVESVAIELFYYEKNLPENIGKPPWFYKNSTFLGSVCRNGKIILVGKDGLVAKTTDNGNTWDKYSTGKPDTLWDIDYSEADNAFVAVGNNGVLIKSTDGESWVNGNSGTAKDIYKIRLKKGGVFVGSTGEIKRKNADEWENPFVEE